MDVAIQVVPDGQFTMLEGTFAPRVLEVGLILDLIIANDLAEAAHVVEGEADGPHELFERGEVQALTIGQEQGLPLESEDIISWSLLLLLLDLFCLDYMGEGQMIFKNK